MSSSRANTADIVIISLVFIVIIMILGGFIFTLHYFAEDRESLRNTLLFPGYVITDKGTELRLGFSVAHVPEDEIVETVVLKRGGKEYYYDLRR